MLICSIFERSNIELLLDTVLPLSDRLNLSNAVFTLSNPSGFRYGLALLNHLLGKVSVGCERIPRARLVTVMHDFPASTVTVSPSESASTSQSVSLSHSMELEVPKSENNSGEAKEPSDGEKESATPSVISLPMTRVIFDDDEHFDLQSARPLYESHVPIDSDALLPAIATILLQRQTDLLGTLGASGFPSTGERSVESVTTGSSASSVNSNGRRSRVASVSNRDRNGNETGAKNGRASDRTFGFQRLQVLKCFEQLIDLGTP